MLSGIITGLHVVVIDPTIAGLLAILGLLGL
jgi:hypothetical protein